LSGISSGRGGTGGSGGDSGGGSSSISGSGSFSCNGSGSDRGSGILVVALGLLLLFLCVPRCRKVERLT